jgi:hypothetical protein
MKCARKFEDSRTDQWEAVFSFVRDLLIGEVLLSFATLTKLFEEALLPFVLSALEK